MHGSRTSLMGLMVGALSPMMVVGQANLESSMSRTLQINSLNDFCLFAPPEAGVAIGDSEAYEVAYCTAQGRGTRTIPAGTIKSAHFLSTPHYTQITGTGDFTKINVQRGDDGGELDPHGATGQGNPVGGTVYSGGAQIGEWHEFISDTEFCIRVCKPADDAWLWCQHIYDLQGCSWNDPGNYGSGFDTCSGAGTTLPPGIYSVNGGLSTFQQGDGSTPAPPPHAAGATSNCQAQATINGGAAAAVTTPATSTSSASSSSSTSTSSKSNSSVPVSSAMSSSTSSFFSANATSSTLALNSTSSSTSTTTTTSTTASISSSTTTTISPSTTTTSTTTTTTTTSSTSTVPAATSAVPAATTSAAARSAASSASVIHLPLGGVGALVGCVILIAALVV